MFFTDEQLKGLDALAAAILRRAIDDYKLAYMAYLKTGNKNELNELKDFFFGDWYRGLTDIEPSLIIDKVEQDCKERFERKRKREQAKHKNQVPEGHSAD